MYRNMVLRTLLESSEKLTFLQIYQWWALNSGYEGNRLQEAIDNLVADGVVRREDNVFSLARPLTPQDYPVIC